MLSRWCLVVRNPPANAGDVFLDQEDPLEKEMATHSSILAWRIPMDRGALVGVSSWGCRVRHPRGLRATRHINTRKVFNPPVPSRPLRRLTAFLVASLVAEHWF